MFIQIFLPPLMLFAGGFFLYKLNFFFILHPIRTLKFTFGGENTKKSFYSLMLALAGTLGVGNIVGVMAGLAVGGAGSVFWLMLSSLLSAAVKYAEVSLSYNTGTGLGMIGVMENEKSSSGGIRGKLYALLCIGLALSMGAVLQGSAIRGSASHYIKMPPLAVVLTLLCIIICKRGGEGIKKAVAFTVPFAVIIYTGMCFAAIIPNICELPSVIRLIFSSAFDIKSISGGIAGGLTKCGIKEGFRIGLLSNEAGAGTSSFSHTSHGGENPARAGCFGIIEVIFDTLLLCPLTAFTVLLCGKDGAGGIYEISEIFSQYIGPVSHFLLIFAISAFALSTILCWYYYGELCLKHLTKGKGKAIYFTAFCALFFVSLTFDTVCGISLSDTLISDTLLFFLFLITLYTLIKNSGRVKPPPELK